MKYYNIVLIGLVIIILLSINAVAEEDVLDKKAVIIKLVISPYYKVDVEPKEIVITEEDFLQAPKIDEDKIAIEKIDEYVFKFSSNIPYRLWISAENDNFSGAMSSIPVESFQWRMNKNDPWTPLSKDAHIFLENPDIGVEYMNIDFRLVVDPYIIPPGLYEGDIIFTFESLES